MKQIAVNNIDALDRNPLDTASIDSNYLKPRSEEYLNLTIFGTCIGGCVSDADEIAKAYNAALLKYPAPKTCSQLTAAINSIQAEIDTEAQKQAQSASTGGSGRPQGRAIQALTQRQGELKALSAQWYCEEYAAKQEQASQVEMGRQQIEYAKNLFSDTDKTTTYVVYGMIGLVVVASMVMILKK